MQTPVALSKLYIVVIYTVDNDYFVDEFPFVILFQKLDKYQHTVGPNRDFRN